MNMPQGTKQLQKKMPRHCPSRLGMETGSTELADRTKAAVPRKAQPAPSTPPWDCQQGTEGLGQQRWATKSRWQSGVKPVRCRSPRGEISSGTDGARGAGRGRRYRAVPGGPELGAAVPVPDPSP